MWQDRLEELRTLERDLGLELNKGASEKEIKLIKDEYLTLFKTELPKAYLEVLRTVNGMDFNGFVIYGIDKVLLDDLSGINEEIYGVIEHNGIFHELDQNKDYVFLGESNISLYVYEITSKTFFELDNPSGEKMESFSTFYALFNKLLEDCLM